MKTPKPENPAHKKRKNKSKKSRGWFKFLALLCGIPVFILVAGFVIFADKVDGTAPPKTLEKADGIVVWTGTGGGRLEAAAELLKNNKGERLLISGVNTDLSPETVLNLLDLSDEKKACCVDLDYAAKDTIGNARETAIWAEALGYNHILLVTSAYHMPRAKSEIAVASGRMRVTAYPVPSDEIRRWYSDEARFKRLLNEYAKLILTQLRGTNTRSRESVPNVPLPKEGEGETKP